MCFNKILSFKNFTLQFVGSMENWKHPTFWLYVTDKSCSVARYHTTKSISIGYCLYWLNKPWTWFLCRTNGAVKGKDKCLDFNLHLFVFHFGYTDYDYNLRG